jgi:hypothetical protein
VLATQHRRGQARALGPLRSQPATNVVALPKTEGGSFAVVFSGKALPT